MSTAAVTSFERDALQSLGTRCKLARLRRNLSQQDVAERAGITRPTYLKLEKGEPSVGLLALIKVLSVLGYTERLADLLATDPKGEDLEAYHGRKRAGRRPDVADF